MGADVLGIDLSTNMIRAARQRLPAIDFRVGNAEALEFDDESFDLVLFAFNGLDYLHPKVSRLNAIGEVRRVLRPKGRFILSHHTAAAVIFGWHRSLGPRRLLYRARLIASGTAFRDQYYVPSVDGRGLITYFAWPRVVIADLRAAGFELLSIYPNSLLIDIVRRGLRTSWLTRSAEPWPYYTFRKT